MVDEDAQPATALGCEVRHDPRQVVDPAQVLHDHTDVPQVLAPDLLDQFRVVPALDEDPAGQCRPGPALRAADRARRGPWWAPGRARPRSGDDHRPPFVGQSPAEREAAPFAFPILQHHQAVLPEQHRAAEAAGQILQHLASLEGELGADRPAGALPAGGEHVAGVADGRSRSPGQRRCGDEAVPGSAPGDVRTGGLLGLNGRAADVPARLGAVPVHAAAASGLRGAVSDHARRAAQGRRGRFRRGADRARAARSAVASNGSGPAPLAEITHLGTQDGFVGLVARGGRRFQVRALAGGCAASEGGDRRARRSGLGPGWRDCVRRPSGRSAALWPWPASSPSRSGRPTSGCPTSRWRRRGSWRRSRRSPPWTRSSCSALRRSSSCSRRLGELTEDAALSFETPWPDGLSRLTEVGGSVAFRRAPSVACRCPRQQADRQHHLAGLRGRVDQQLADQLAAAADGLLHRGQIGGTGGGDVVETADRDVPGHAIPRAVRPASTPRASTSLRPTTAVGSIPASTRWFATLTPGFVALCPPVSTVTVPGMVSRRPRSRAA